jgi:Protein of unknown function (DUF2589)
MAKNYAVEAISSLPFGMLIGGPLNAAIEAQAQAAKSTIDFILQVGFLPASAVNAGALVADPDPVEVSEPDAVPAPGTNPMTAAGQTRMVTFSYTTTNEDPAMLAMVTAAQAAAAGAANAAAAPAAVQLVPGVTPAVTAAVNAAVAAPNATPQTVAAAIVPSLTNQTATISVPILSVVPIPFFAIEEMTIDFMAKITEAITSNSKSQKNKAMSASTQAKGGWGPVSGSMKAGMSSTHSSTSERSSKYQTELTMSIHVRATSESMPKGMARVLDMLAGLIKSERT